VRRLRLSAGFAFTVWSEWYNVYVLRSWAYAPAMPLVAGLGLAPLLPLRARESEAMARSTR
jgi:hypothetical protein